MRVGLCATCAHRKAVGNRRGSAFILCRRSQSDPAFPRYPALPMVRCNGYEKSDEDPWKAFNERKGDQA